MEDGAQVKGQVSVPGLAVDAQLTNHATSFFERLIAQNIELVDEIDIRFNAFDAKFTKNIDVLRVVYPVGSVHEHPQSLHFSDESGISPNKGFVVLSVENS
jgi:hypothetical protein